MIKNKEAAHVLGKGQFDTYKSHCSKFFLFELVILLVCPVPRWNPFITISYTVQVAPPETATIP